MIFFLSFQIQNEHTTLFSFRRIRCEIYGRQQNWVNKHTREKKNRTDQIKFCAIETRQWRKKQQKQNEHEQKKKTHAKHDYFQFKRNIADIACKARSTGTAQETHSTAKCNAVPMPCSHINSQAPPFIYDCVTKMYDNTPSVVCC